MRVRKMDESQRGMGFTTAQMQLAPRGALFVWPAHGSISYAKELASKIGRDDLEIVTPSVLDCKGERLRGRMLSAIVLDHACEPSAEEYDLLRELRARCCR